MQDYGNSTIPSERAVEPALPIEGPTRFFRLDRGFSDRAMDRVEWVNAPKATWDLGFGHGFDILTDELRGMERLQAVYADRSMGSARQHHPDAALLADALVIVRFQRLLQEALAFSKTKLPFYATAHDHYDLLTCVKRAPPSGS
jgi:hypothetical protein